MMGGMRLSCGHAIGDRTAAAREVRATGATRCPACNRRVVTAEAAEAAAVAARQQARRDAAMNIHIHVEQPVAATPDAAADPWIA